MANSVLQDRQGPDWPLGLIACATPGTPVGIMSLVDPSSYNAPETASSSSASGQAQGAEYTVTAYQIIFQPCRAGASHGLATPTGNVYICRKGAAGSGNRDDPGVIIAALSLLPGSTAALAPAFTLTSAARNRDSFSPYRYYIDADNAGDGCIVTLIIQ